MGKIGGADMMSRTIKRVAAVFLLLLAISAFSRIPAAQVKSPSPPDPFQLALILKAGREHCQRLEKAALDFVCQEEVTDRIDLSRDGRHELAERGVEVSGTFNLSDTYRGGAAGGPPPRNRPH